MRSYYVLSFSGGKDSTALCLEWLKRHGANPAGYPLDEVMYCDTGKEFSAMAEHVNKIEQLVMQSGIKFVRLQGHRSFDYIMFDETPKRRNPKREGLTGYSWPGPCARWCTGKLKTQVINRHLRELRQHYRVVQLIGLAADEKERLSRKNNLNPEHHHPLVEWGWTEADCLQYCYSRGFDWGGLYEMFGRVSCWCCPLQNLEELRNLRKNFPELWTELLDMEHRTWRNFRADYTVDELEIRFALEDEWSAKGLPINMNKAFKEELKKRLGRR